jgi:hypothetical protein
MLRGCMLDSVSMEDTLGGGNLNLKFDRLDV